MPAYIVVEVQVHDPVTYDRYKQLAPPSIATYGGRYLTRGGAIETLEGDWCPPRLVILEFPDLDRARAWWDSPEYRAARDLRHSVATSRMIALEGVPPGYVP